MRRRFLLARREQQAKRSTDDFVGSSLQEINDDATATSTVAYSASTSVELAPLVVEQIVAYSSTWKVPILYFCAHEKGALHHISCCASEWIFDPRKL